MNTKSLIATGLVCATALTIATLATHAGPLTPPAGPVTSTNKTLAEVEPRIAINATNTPGDADSIFRIAAPGSYYLTGNIAGVVGKHGIEIASSGVTLDLMGFDLLGVPGSLDGVNVSVASVSIDIHNGSVRSWGSAGVDAGNTSNSSLRNLRAEGNVNGGLRLGVGGLVEDCAALSNGLFGIFAGSGSTVSGNTAASNTGDGIQVPGDCLVLNNNCDSNGFSGGNGAGILAMSSDNRIDGNNVTDNDRGIDVTFAGNLIIRNSASGNTVNYAIVANNKVGIVVSAPNSPGVFGSTGGAGVGTTDPWANFSY